LGVGRRGTKTKDLVLWVLFPSAALAIFLPRAAIVPFSVLAIACGGYFWWHHLVYVPAARKKSAALRLAYTVLLPVPLWWAKILLRASGGRLDTSGVARAYEVHVEIPHGLGLADFCYLLGLDLALANRLFPGCLFLWETAAPLPAPFRALVRREAARGRAFWAKGGWRVPRFPLTGLDLKKGTVRRGAVVVPGQCCR